MFRAIRRSIRVFFGFSRTETNGFIVLLPLMALILFSQPLYRAITRRAPDLEADKKRLDSLVALWDKQELPAVVAPEKPAARFHFNPNTATVETLTRLGFPEKLAGRVIRYREKGGTFRYRRDLLKMYGIDTAFFETLIPFIDLPEKREAYSAQSFRKDLFPRKQIAGAFTKKRTVEAFDINLADTAQLKKIYGIGEKLSIRIIRYRDQLGGFISTAQVAEVYGLDSTVVKKLVDVSFVATGFQPKMLDINRATEKELSAHPYLSKLLAKAIVAYRFQHGNFRSADDIRKLEAFRKEKPERIFQYLIFGE